MRQKLVAALAISMVGLVVPVSAAGATRPPDVTCGQVVTTDVTLRSDLTCTGDALTIAANDVTVRLAGHTITSGDGTGTGIVFGDPGTGSCVTGATVSGGTVTGFATGIGDWSGCTYAHDDAVRGMQLLDNTWGISVPGLTLDVDRSTIDGPNGIDPYCPVCESGGQVNLTRSSVTATGVNVSSFGIFHSISDSRLVGGTIYSEVNGPIHISGSRLLGVTLDCGDASFTIVDTTILGGGGLSGGACSTLLQHDRFVGPGSGIGFEPGPGYPMTVTDSVFTGWNTAVVVDDQATITGSTFRDNATGVACTARYCEGGTVTGNRFVANSGTGLLLTTGLWHVGSNEVLRNGGLGIDAEGPTLTVVDDGGNVARRNLAPQCVGVVCTP